MNGRAGKILRVDLSHLEYTIEELDREKLSVYIGGRGLAVKIFSDEVGPNIEPLSPKNKIIFMTGSLTGSGVLCSVGTSIITKSPRHESIAISNLTGSFGLELKQAGFDGVILEGKAQEPIVIEINDGEVYFKPAQSLWGKTTWQTEDKLKRQVKNAWKADEYSFLSIGPAGENLSPLATIIHNKFREGGQGGAGAVMGSKNVKAIMVWGNQEIGIANPKDLRYTSQIALEKYKTLPVVPSMLRNLGTASLVRIANKLGVLPTNNFSNGFSKRSKSIYSETLAESIWQKPKACPTCPIACTRIAMVPGKRGQIIEGPEYETLVFLGSVLGISKVDIILDAMCECLKQGLDIPGTGLALATAMELQEKGFDVDGLTLKFGFDKGSIVKKALKLMAVGKNDGAVLAKGGAAISRRVGHPECYMGVRNMETLIADPRGLAGLGLLGATSNNGTEYNSSFLVAALAHNITQGLDMEKTENRPIFAIRMQNTTAMSESLGLCPMLLLGIEIEDIDAMAASVTETTYGKEGLLKIGERIWNMERSYHLKSGWKPSDDMLPARFTQDPMPDGQAKGMVCDLSEDLPLYYEMRGWDENGVPGSGKLKALDLQDLAVGK